MQQQNNVGNTVTSSDVTGHKYLPPHLRNSGGSASNNSNNSHHNSSSNSNSQTSHFDGGNQNERRNNNPSRGGGGRGGGGARGGFGGDRGPRDRDFDRAPRGGRGGGGGRGGRGGGRGGGGHHGGGGGGGGGGGREWSDDSPAAAPPVRIQNRQPAANANAGAAAPVTQQLTQQLVAVQTDGAASDKVSEAAAAAGGGDQVPSVAVDLKAVATDAPGGPVASAAPAVAPVARAPQKDEFPDRFARFADTPAPRRGGNVGGRGGRGGGGGGGAPADGKWTDGDIKSSNGDVRSGGGGGGGGRGGRGGRNRVPERNARMEKELFGAPDQQTKGINFGKYEDIPVEASGRDVPKEIDDFKSVEFHDVVALNIELAGYDKPTPVQRYAIPISLSQRDLISCAQTGSGKTAAFLFPVIHALMSTEMAERPSQGGYRGGASGARPIIYPYCLVLAPTRELVMQIHQEARKFCYRTNLKPVVAYGGQPVRDQLRELERGCEILIATPGRLKDFLDRGRLSLSYITHLVLDEADRMLDMGFEPQIREIVEQCDMPPERQTAMFSATFPKEIQRLAQDFLTDYIFLAVGRVGSTTDMITQHMEYVEDHEKRDKLMTILPECDGLTLIFVETKRNADVLESFLIKEGIQATSIHGDRSQPEREEALQMFRCGRCPVLVATDVAARGLDIPNVLHVVNYDLPNDIDSYVHRIGRTGRCGNAGTAIAFCNEKNRAILKDLHVILSEAKQEVPRWFENLAFSSSFGGGGGGRGGRGRGRGRGRGNFGGRDMRKYNDDGDSWGGGGGGGGGSAGGSESKDWTRKPAPAPASKPAFAAKLAAAAAGAGSAAAAPRPVVAAKKAVSSLSRPAGAASAAAAPRPGSAMSKGGAYTAQAASNDAW